MPAFSSSVVLPRARINQRAVEQLVVPDSSSGTWSTLGRGRSVERFLSRGTKICTPARGSRLSAGNSGSASASNTVQFSQEERIAPPLVGMDG